MARVSNSQTLPFIGTGATYFEALEAAGMQLEAFKAENPNKEYIGFSTTMFVEDVDGVPTKHVIAWVSTSKSDLPD